MAYSNPEKGQPPVQYPTPTIYSTDSVITYQRAMVKQFGPHYHRHSSIGLGATQIILACISIAAGIMVILFESKMGYIGVGIWAGVLYLVAGSIAIAAGKNATNGLITATLVFSVLVITFGVAQIVIVFFGIAEDGYCECNVRIHEAIAGNSMMIAVASLEIIFGFCLMGVCARAIHVGSKAKHVTVPATFEPTQS